MLGSLLVPALEAASWQVTCWPGDVRQLVECPDTFDCVFHLAALNKLRHDVSAVDLFDVNVSGMLAVLRYCDQTKTRCIFASSSGVYRPTAHLTALSENAPREPVSIYGTSKLAAELLCCRLAETSGASLTSLRIFNMYGPGQSTDFLVPQMMSQAHEGRHIELQRPTAVRDFVYVTDVVGAFVAAGEQHHEEFLPLNVGTGLGVSVLELAQAVVDGDQQISAEDLAPEPNFVVADVSRVESVLGWTASVSLDQGIALLRKSTSEPRLSRC